MQAVTKKNSMAAKPYTTNQRMEITAAIKRASRLGLGSLARWKLYSDKAITSSGAFSEGWLINWQRERLADPKQSVR